ncbi:MAG: hypothetical protein OXF26_10725, partial [Alphaproteobacteria bacterium]|nr:hypothetical protein [Alphaproteobacteria bacterium]
YKGIPGEIFCLGKDCEVDTNGKLVGSWYFSPTSPMAYYTKNADDENYSPETLYATYGHWLTVDDSGVATVHTFAHFGGTTGATPNTPGVWSAADPSSDDAGLKLSTATYSGKAAGRSVRRVVATDGSQSGIHSGRFTADVTLTAQFATAPMLGGTIRNFQSPDNPSAVGNWTVKLTDTAVSSGTLTGGTVDTEPANVTGGSWSATSYGEADKRPTGIYGGFRAHFTDGDVAGAYATRHR